jgi:predicted nucleotide-binding protein (sugar kinase/HSP70/actin superfamily)
MGVKVVINSFVCGKKAFVTVKTQTFMQKKEKSL